MKKGKILVFVLLSCLVMVSTTVLATQSEKTAKISGEEALQKLMTGNQQYVAAKSAHPNQTAERRAEIAKDQNPFAIIISCSDSRVPPEVIFDQGLGDLFIIRLAGNVIDDMALGSIEYAAEHLGVPLLMVLGHERCGAVTASTQGPEAPGHISAVVKAIQPAVEKAKGQPGDLVENAAKANVEMIVETLKSSTPILAHLNKEGKLKIVGAHYDLDTGVVEIIKP